MTELLPNWLQFPHVRTIAEAFCQQGAVLRFVGGCVRDSIIGRAVSDIDAATPLQPEDVIQLLENAGIKAVPTGLKHGTITAVSDGQSIEITTLRRDTACDGRHAAVEFTGSWEEDAGRRDFTMNALYLSPEGELFDFTGGIEDTKAGCVRFIGHADDRIKEDYLRILRFFRFYAYYGKTEANSDALAASARHRDGIAGLSGERIQAEMLKLLSAPDPLPSLKLMYSAGLHEPLVLGHELHHITALLKTEQDANIAAGQATRLATLLAPSQVKELAARWKLSAAMQDELYRLIEDSIDPVLDEAGQKRHLRRIGKDTFVQQVLFDWARNGKHNYPAMLTLAQNWNIPQFPVTGADLRAQGIKEGKELGDALRKLEARWEASDYRLTKKELLG